MNGSPPPKGNIRLHVWLAKTGACSRRTAELWIQRGRVSVNGKIIKELGTQIDPTSDRVFVDGKFVGEAQEKATLILHKPDNVMSTLLDPEGRRTVSDLLRAEPYRLVPVGRLDYHTEGLLLLSSDGELVYRLTHPRFHVEKQYWVRTKAALGAITLGKLRAKIVLDDGPVKAVSVTVLEETDRHTWLQIIVTEGRNQLIRRMLEAFRLPVYRLVRSGMGGHALGTLRAGEYRYLTLTELQGLYTAAGLEPNDAVLSHRALATAHGPLGKAERERGRLPGDPT